MIFEISLRLVTDQISIGWAGSQNAMVCRLKQRSFAGLSILRLGRFWSYRTRASRAGRSQASLRLNPGASSGRSARLILSRSSQQPSRGISSRRLRQASSKMQGFGSQNRSLKCVSGRIDMIRNTLCFTLSASACGISNESESPQNRPASVPTSYGVFDLTSAFHAFFAEGRQSRSSKSPVIPADLVRPYRPPDLCSPVDG